MVIGIIVQGAKSLFTPLIQPLFVPLLYVGLTSLGTILSVWTNGDRIQDENELLNPLKPKPYDYIIVGAGSAGCLLANRLSRKNTVLLIEAGGEPNPLQFIPGFSLFFANFPETDWGHRTVPQKFGSLISANGESSWSTGRGLGGTGTLNYMIHLRGHRKDFDNWANITGDPSWSWEGVLPYFKSYENYEVPGDNVNHGYSGDLRIEAPDFPSTALHFVRAGGEIGFPNVDLNAPYREGFDIIRYPMLRGVRQAPYKGLLEPVRNRASLTILKFAQVNKILFREGNIAYGVEYDRHGMTYVAHAKREVIVSAGTVGSPKLLMLSGVGKSRDLQELNIPVVADLPVGENLQDHLASYLPFFIREGLGYYIDRDLTIGEIIKWFTLGRGRLSNSGCESTGLISSEFAKARGEADWPDIQFFQYGLTNFRDAPESVSRIFNLRFDEIDQFVRGTVGKDSVYLVISGARPLSRGFIKLGGHSPYDNLIIDPNYFGDPEETDVKVMVEGIKRAVYMMENTTAGGDTMGARFISSRLPGCEHLVFRSDEYFTCYARRLSVTLHHPVGTCSMGSVVDTELRVLGTRNLRVIDASIQPVVVTTNTQASTLMIAEKGADMILKYWDAQSIKQGNGRSKSRSKLPWLGLFGGDEDKGGFKRGNDEQYGVVLEGPLGGIGSLFGRQQPKRNESSNKGEVSNLRGIGLEQDYEVPIQPVPARHKIPSYDSEAEMVEKLKQSLEQLRMVSDITKESYNGHWLQQQQLKQRPNLEPEIIPGTTSRPYSRVPTTTPSPPKQNEVDYYYEDDDDGGYSSGGDGYTSPPSYQRGKGFRGGGNRGIPIPPSPPQPTRKPSQYLRESLSLSQNEQEVGLEYPNSLNDIQQFYGYKDSQQFYGYNKDDGQQFNHF